MPAEKNKIPNNEMLKHTFKKHPNEKQPGKWITEGSTTLLFSVAQIMDDMSCGSADELLVSFLFLSTATKQS